MIHAKPRPESKHDEKSSAQRMRWPCLRGSGLRRRTASKKKQPSRLAKSVSMVAITNKAMRLAKATKKCDTAHVLIACSYRDDTPGFFGIKLEPATAIDFFEAGLRLARNLANEEADDE